MLRKFGWQAIEFPSRRRTSIVFLRLNSTNFLYIPAKQGKGETFRLGGTCDGASHHCDGEGSPSPALPYTRRIFLPRECGYVPRFSEASPFCRPGAAALNHFSDG